MKTKLLYQEVEGGRRILEIEELGYFILFANTGRYEKIATRPEIDEIIVEWNRAKKPSDINSAGSGDVPSGSTTYNESKQDRDYHLSMSLSMVEDTVYIFSTLVNEIMFIKKSGKITKDETGLIAKQMEIYQHFACEKSEQALVDLIEHIVCAKKPFKTITLEMPSGGTYQYILGESHE